MAEHTNWSVASDKDGSQTYITPVQVTRGTPPVRSPHSSGSSSSSRSSRSSHHRSIPSMATPTPNGAQGPNSITASLSRVAISNVLTVRGHELQQANQNRVFLSTQALLQQKEQMQKNNEELNKYMMYKRELEDKIRQLERENSQLREERASGVAPEPNFTPQQHRKQKIINELHAQIFKSQKDYDDRVEEINEITFRTQTLKDDIKHKTEKIHDLEKERENQLRKASAHKLQVPRKEDERDRLEQQIARNEQEFQNAYVELMKRLAEVKPVEIPEEAAKPDGSIQKIRLDHIKQQMIRIRREIQEINDNVERNQELQKLRQSKDQLEKANEAMNKQTDLLEKKMEIISNENVETKRHTAAKQAEVDNLRKAYEDEHRDHDLKMKKLHEEYKMLYDKYHSILNEITEQKERATQHKSIKEELEEMRRLLNMKRLSMASTTTRGGE